MSKFKFTKAPIPGILTIEPTVNSDHRGFFMEYYNKESFAENGFKDLFVQDNHSRSKKGVLRGLHFQLNPHPMGKLIKVVKGRVFDVGVDVRKGSPTFGKWFGGVLSGDDHKMFYFPPGFAHGFLAIGDDNEVLYKCTGVYNVQSERALLWNDPDIGIKWPLNEVADVILSDKDKVNPKLKDVQTNIDF